MNKLKLSNLPTTPGVYIYKNKNAQVLYVGKAVNIKNRVKQYFAGQDSRAKIKRLVPQIHKIETIEVNSEFEALLLEAALIKKHQPHFNTVSKDDKHPLYIAITKEEFPKVGIARRPSTMKPFNHQTIKPLLPADYFGPFPSAFTVRQVLKFLRRVFPYCSCKSNKGRPCLYASIGLCRPCPRGIPSLTKERLGGVNKSLLSNLDQKLETRNLKLKSQYRKQIRLLKKLLSGQAPQVLRSLERDMNKSAKQQDYEQAAFYRDGLINLQRLLQPNRPIEGYLDNPNLRLELRQEALRQLKNILNSQNITPKIKTLHRIECYDISTLSGKYSTGSMVILTQGEPDKSQYRRFKIKEEGIPNDVAMMREMLSRRFQRYTPPCQGGTRGGTAKNAEEHPEWNTLNHKKRNSSPGVDRKSQKSQKHSKIRNLKIENSSWPLPDLIILDGGLPQLSTALRVLKQKGLKIPAIGLAKRLEEIHIPIADSPPAKGGLGGVTLKNTNNLPKNRKTKKQKFEITKLLLPKSNPSLHLLQHLRDEAHRFANKYRKKLLSKI